MVDVLRGTVSNKAWSVPDIVRAHRLNLNQCDFINRLALWSPCFYVGMTKWMLEKGRPKLGEMGVKVAGDLTTCQQQVLKDHRN